ncbi:MAG: hypothetical protein ACTSP4_15020 [Candidatus Hodarchaeales archaeon]
MYTTGKYLVKRSKKKRRKDRLIGLDPETREFPIIDIAYELEEKQMLPALYLIFSKKACEKAALIIADDGSLLNQTEKIEIEKAISEIKKDLSTEDMQLDQLHDVFHCLRAGVCFHHAGTVCTGPD